MIFKLIKNNINVYSAHTPMDVSTIGLNMFMAKKLGLSEIEPLERYVSDKCCLLYTFGRPRTLEEVGDIFCVTRERIRQIEAKALRKLRHPTRSKKLRDFL